MTAFDCEDCCQLSTPQRYIMAPSGRRLVCAACSLALCQAFQLPRSATQPRHPRTAVDADLLDSTLSLANAEEFLGGIVGFLPLIARPSA